MAATLDEILDRIADDQGGGRATATLDGRPAWPMIILRTPKGWTCPAEIDGHPVENNWRAHQVPLANARDTEAHTRLLEELDALLPARGAVRRGRRARSSSSPALAPEGERRMSANPVANGGLLRRDLRLPDFRDYAVDVSAAGRLGGRGDEGARRVAPGCDPSPTRTTSASSAPDETASNRLQAGLRGHRQAVERRVPGRSTPTTTWRRSGRVMEMLSEHQCQGWLEGYLLTGRHGLFTSYEAFIHIVDSMFNQHAKWLKSAGEVSVAPARRLAQLPAQLARLAAGPQRRLAPGPRASSTTSSTRRPTSCASTCRSTRTRCSRPTTTACAPSTT